MFSSASTPVLSWVLLAAISLADSPMSAADWTGWLGPQRNGWVADFQAPTAWPEQLQQVWRREVGAGYGTPLVSDDRVYQHARQGNDEVLWCLDLASGEVIWKAKVKTPFKIAGGGEYHGKGPKSNPALSEGRIFTLGITGVVSAFDASSGDLIWQRDESQRFDRAFPNWGASTSPLVDGDRMIIHLGGDDEGLLIAFDVKSGKKLWHLGNDGAAYASPFVATLEGVRQVIEWNHNALTGVDIQTGKRLWDYPFAHVGSNQNMPSPIFHQDRVFVGGENRGIRCVKPHLKDGRWTAEELWYQKKLALDMATPIANGERLFGLSHYRMGQLFCLDTETGDIIWLGPGRRGDNATFLSIPQHIITLIDTGELLVISTEGDELETVASYTVSDQPTWAAPVLLDSGFLIKDRGTLARWIFPNDPLKKAPNR